MLHKQFTKKSKFSQANNFHKSISEIFIEDCIDEWIDDRVAPTKPCCHLKSSLNSFRRWCIMKLYYVNYEIWQPTSNESSHNDTKDNSSFCLSPDRYWIHSTHCPCSCPFQCWHLLNGFGFALGWRWWRRWVTGTFVCVSGVFHGDVRLLTSYCRSFVAEICDFLLYNYKDAYV